MLTAFIRLGLLMCFVYLLLHNESLKTECLEIPTIWFVHSSVGWELRQGHIMEGCLCSTMFWGFSKVAPVVRVWFEYFCWDHVSGILVPALTAVLIFHMGLSLLIFGLLIGTVPRVQVASFQAQKVESTDISRSSLQSYMATPTVFYWSKQATGSGKGGIDSASWCESRKAALQNSMLGWKISCGHLWKHNLPCFALFISVYQLLA